MTASEVKSNIHHSNWVRPLKENKVQLTLFRAVIAWSIPNMNLKFDYER